MGKVRIALTVMLLFATSNSIRAADECLSNGSFEADGLISNVATRPPSGWDVNVPAGTFSGRVVSSWSTDGLYGLSLTANWFVTFTGGETATVSQMLVLDDVQEVGFDLRLRVSGRPVGWKPNTCTAVVRIDQDTVWESNFDPADIQGDYPDQTCQVAEKYRDGQPHRLALGLQMHVGGMLYEQYESYWDAVECRARTPDDGNDVEFLPGDLDRDGLVDTGDLMMMADMWLQVVPVDSPYNLFTGVDEGLDGMDWVNLLDLAALSDSWRGGRPVQAP
jgi:hypothetical protein